MVTVFVELRKCQWCVCVSTEKAYVQTFLGIAIPLAIECRPWPASRMNTLMQAISRSQCPSAIPSHPRLAPRRSSCLPAEGRNSSPQWSVKPVRGAVGDRLASFSPTALQSFMGTRLNSTCVNDLFRLLVSIRRHFPWFPTRRYGDSASPTGPLQDLVRQETGYFL